MAKMNWLKPISRFFRRRPFGGTCALRGCDPKKVLVGVADVVDSTKRLVNRGVALEGSGSISTSEFVANVVAGNAGALARIEREARTQFSRNHRMTSGLEHAVHAVRARAPAFPAIRRAPNLKLTHYRSGGFYRLARIDAI